MNKTNLIICLVLFFLLFFITGCDVIPHDVPPVRLNPPWITRHNITSSQYQDAFDTYTEDGYRLTYVNCHNYNGSVRYNAIWEKIGGPSWYAFHGQTADEYQVKVDELKELGFHPVLVNPCNVNGQVYFASIFEQRNVAWIARHGLTHAEYQSEFDEHGENGYYLQFVAGYQEGNQARYAAIWEKTTGPPLLAAHGMTSGQYQDLVNLYEEDGFQPVLVDGFYIGREPYFVAIWHQKNTCWSARHNVAMHEYQKIFEDHYYEGFRPKIVAGYGYGSGTTLMACIYNNIVWNLTDLDYINSMVNQLRIDNGVEAVSLAITIDERLVYAKAFGQVDTENNETAHTSHRFRIASNSKAITGAAISHLVDIGAISLNDHVFGSGGLLEHQFSLSTSPSAVINNLRLQAIRVRHLAEHTAGGWWSQLNDPVSSAAHRSLNRDDFIQAFLVEFPLDNFPGDNYAYSNVGYNILEVVIEQATGVPYEQYIRELLFIPSGADSFAIATNTLAQRLPNEAKYYGGWAYVENFTRMAGHGGWVCTPIDYLRLMTRLDAFPNRPDLLTSNGMLIFAASHENPPNEPNRPYAKGIRANTTQWTHNGILSGSASLYQRWSDGYSIMIIANNNAGDNLPGNFYALTSAIHDNVTEWPDHDLF